LEATIGKERAQTATFEGVQISRISNFLNTTRQGWGGGPLLQSIRRKNSKNSGTLGHSEMVSGEQSGGSGKRAPPECISFKTGRMRAAFHGKREVKSDTGTLDGNDSAPLRSLMGNLEEGEELKGVMGTSPLGPQGWTGGSKKLTTEKQSPETRGGSPGQSWGLKGF